MKITQSQVALSSQHEATRQTRVEERLRLWRGDRSLDVERQSVDSVQTRGQAGAAQQQGGAGPSAWLHLSPQALQARPVDVPGLAVGRPAAGPREVRPPPSGAEAKPPHSPHLDEVPSAPEASTPQEGDGRLSLEPRLQMVVRMVEALTGERVRLVQAADFEPGAVSATSAPPSESAKSGPSTEPPPADNAPEGWGLSYDRAEVQHETEHTTVAAQGMVQTADGQSIAFELRLDMQRAFTSASQTSVRAGDAVLKDPLVLQFDGPAAALSNTRFDFDLDADGRTESMPFVGSGSGFLVLDRNANGQVDDGHELFGALSGDGFADLAALDGDGNGWIDEADTAFKQLQVWQKDAQGQDQLRSLTQAGVGALYLGRVASPFSVRSADNATLGEVRSSGLYLTEDGQARAMQQIDVAV